MTKELLGSIQINRIYQFDCVAGMKLLPEKCIDLTVTSPPYDNLRKYNGYSFDFEAVANELYRLTKNGGIVVWVVGDATIKGSETGTSFKQALYFKEIGFNLHDTMIYAKENPVPLTHNRYEQQFEFMFILSKGKPAKFNPLTEPTKYAGMTKNRATTLKSREYVNEVVRKREEITHIKDTKYKNNIWFYTVGKNHTSKDADAFKHPAIFPEQLARDHILSWTSEGDVVLDCFMGSGTTAKMALLNNRKFIGFETSREYIEIANTRLDGIGTISS